MSPRWAWVCLLVLSTGASAFWGQNHKDMIGRVIYAGRSPAFTRGSRSIVNVDDYLKQVLYVRGGANQLPAPQNMPRQSTFNRSTGRPTTTSG